MGLAEYPRLAYLSNTRLPGDEPELAYSALAAQGFVEAGADIRLILRRVGRARPSLALQDATGIVLPDIQAIRAPRVLGSSRLFHALAYRRLLRGDRNALLFRDADFLPWAVRLRRRGMRVFFESHRYQGDLRTVRRWLPMIDGVFCTSRPQLERYLTHFPELDVDVALSGTRFPAPNERSGFTRRLGYLDSIQSDYPLDIVMEGLARCRTTDVRLLVVGARDEEQRERIEGTAVELGIFERVEVHGWMLPTELAEQRARVDVGVIPLSESFARTGHTPLKLVECLSASLPTIATRAEVVTAYVTHGREGLLVDRTAESWAKAIDHIYADFDTYRAMAEQALARARELTWTQRAARMLDRIAASLR